MSRYARNKKSVGSNYIHKFRPLGVTNDTDKNKQKMKQYIQSHSDYFPSNIIHKSAPAANNNNNNRRRKPKEKNADELRGALQSRWKQLNRELKPNITRFDNETVAANPEEISLWLRTHAPPGFRPTKEIVTEYENRGFHIANIMYLISCETSSLRADLGLNDGQWTALLCVYDKIFRGDIIFGGQRALNNPLNNPLSNPLNNNGNNMPNNIPNANIDGNDDAKNDNNNNNDSDSVNDGLGDKNMKVTKSDNPYDQYGLWQDIERRQDEGSSNHKQRARQGRVHPFFALAGRGSPSIFSVMRDINLSVYVSTLQHKYCYEITSPYYKHYDVDVLKRVILREHGCDLLHKRFIAQRDATQNVLTNKRLRNDWAQNVRISASAEFALGVSIGEMLQICVRMPTEQTAYTFNQKWMEDDPFDDYKLGEVDPPFDGYNRVPRSERIINQLLAQKKSVATQTVWYARADIFKLHGQLKPQNKWEEKLKQLKEFGVLSFMPIFLARFFPGREEEAKKIGLIPVDDDDKAGALVGSAQKQEIDLSFL
eukprot:166916_1